MLIQKINRLDLQPFKRAFNRPLDLFWLAVHTSPVLPRLRIDVPSKLGRDHHLALERRKRLTDQLLIQERTIGLSGIEERHAIFDRRSNHCDSVLFLDCRTVAESQSHTTKSNRRYFQGTFPQLSFLHCNLPAS